MTRRPRRPARKSGRVSSMVSSVAVSKSLTLREALLAFGDPEEITEMLRLEAAGYGGYGPDILILGGPETQSDLDRSRHWQLHQNAENVLRAKLVTGETVATGRDPRQRIDAPRIRIPSERWQNLAFDFADSVATGDGVRITEVLVPTEGGLHIRKAARIAQLGAIRLTLAPQCFEQLLMLAEGAPAPVASTRMRERLFHEREKKAVSEGIGVLKGQMVRSGLDRALVDDLIVSVRRVGYLLTIPAAEITIEE